MALGSHRSLSGSLRPGPGDGTGRGAPGTRTGFVSSKLICIIEPPHHHRNEPFALLVSQNGNSPVTSLITGVLCNNYYNNKNLQLKNMNKLPLILLSRNNHFICILQTAIRTGVSMQYTHEVILNVTCF